MGLEIQDQGYSNVVKGVPFKLKEPLPLVIEGNSNIIAIEPSLSVEKDCQWVIRGDYNVITLGASVAFSPGTDLTLTAIITRARPWK